MIRSFFFLFLPLLFSACSTAPVSNFLRDLAGTFTLTAEGVEFFALYLPGSAFTQDDVFTVNNAGDWEIDGVVYLAVAQPDTSKRAFYTMPATGQFLALHLDIDTVLASSMPVPTQEEVDFAFLVPFAIRQ